MKKLISILSLLIIANISFGQVKVDVSGDIIPTGNYPAIKGLNVKGTLHSFQTIAQRDALPANYRDTGMLAYVVDSLKYYSLIGGIDNTKWQVFASGGTCDTCISNYAISSDSLLLYFIRVNGDSLPPINFSGGGGDSSGVTAGQVSDSINEVTLQRAFDNSVVKGDNPTVLSNGDDISLFSINGNNTGANIVNYASSTLANGTDTSDMSFTLSSDDLSARIQSRLTSGSMLSSITVFPNRILLNGKDTGGNDKLSIIMKGIDTLTSPPTYIAAFDGDTLKKVAYPTGSGGTCDTCWSTAVYNVDSSMAYILRVNGDTAWTLPLKDTSYYKYPMQRIGDTTVVRVDSMSKVTLIDTIGLSGNDLVPANWVMARLAAFITGSGINIYNTDSLLAGDRTINLNSKFFKLMDSADYNVIYINPVTQTSYMTAGNPSGYSSYFGNNSYFQLYYSNGVINSEIKGDAFKIDYTSATQNFNADSLNFNSNLSGTSAGDVWTLINPATGSGYWHTSSGGVSQATISDTLKNYANSGSITTDNVIYSTPISLSVSNHLMTGAFALKSQSAYTLFGRGSSSGSPSFLSSIDSNWIPALHSQSYYNTKYAAISSPTPQTLTDGSTITWDAALGYNANVTLASTGRTLVISNPVAGAYYTLKIIQDATGSRTITTWPTGIKWPSGVAPTLSTAANAVDFVVFYYNGTNYYGQYNYDFK